MKRIQTLKKELLTLRHDLTNTSAQVGASFCRVAAVTRCWPCLTKRQIHGRTSLPNGQNWEGCLIRKWRNLTLYVRAPTAYDTSTRFIDCQGLRIAKSESSSRMRFESHVLWGLRIFMWMLQLGLMFFYRREAMFYIPQGWLGPFKYLLALPLAPRGSSGFDKVQHLVLFSLFLCMTSSFVHHRRIRECVLLVLCV